MCSLQPTKCIHLTSALACCVLGCLVRLCCWGKSEQQQQQNFFKQCNLFTAGWTLVLGSFCPAPVNSFRLAWCWALCSSTHSFCTVFFSQAFSLVAMNVSYLLSFFSELLDLIFKASPGCGIPAIWKCFYLSSKCEYFLMITEA